MRTDTLNMRMHPKVKFLAEVRSRELGHTLSGFIERAVLAALTDRDFGAPTPGTEPMIPWEQCLANEELWHPDPAMRLRLLAEDRWWDLAPGERARWDLICNQLSTREERADDAKYKVAWNSADFVLNEFKKAKRK